MDLLFLMLYALRRFWCETKVMLKGYGYMSVIGNMLTERKNYDKYIRTKVERSKKIDEENYSEGELK